MSAEFFEIDKLKLQVARLEKQIENYFSCWDSEACKDKYRRQGSESRRSRIS